MSEAFEKWWANEGSTPPAKGDDVETHTMKKCRIAWGSGSYVTEIELQAKIKQLEAQLEEERQENASLRSGSIDDYERGAE
jgi:hypothetical protein